MKSCECLNQREQVKSENKVVERVTPAQVWLLRAESTKVQQSLNCDCFVFSFFARDREDLSKGVGSYRRKTVEFV